MTRGSIEPTPRPRTPRQPRPLPAFAMLRTLQAFTADARPRAVAIQRQAVPAQTTRAFHDAPPAHQKSANRLKARCQLSAIREPEKELSAP